MPFITVPGRNDPDVEIHYEDVGAGKPVVLIHGWPLSSRSGEGQVPALVDAGYRVITYDRRGFGQSSQPWNGYDYDTLAADLKAVFDTLDLRDVTLIGFSMGGGEVARYVGTYGTDRVAKLVFASAVPPYLWKSEDNPDGGVDAALAQCFHDGLTGDRPAFLHEFIQMFFTVGTPSPVNKPTVSSEQIAYNLDIAEMASPKGTLDCTTAFAKTDFRVDLTKITVPTLVIHGDSDTIVPFEVSGKRTHEAISGSELVLIHDAPTASPFHIRTSGTGRTRLPREVAESKRVRTDAVRVRHVIGETLNVDGGIVPPWPTQTHPKQIQRKESAHESSSEHRSPAEIWSRRE